MENSILKCVTSTTGFPSKSFAIMTFRSKRLHYGSSLAIYSEEGLRTADVSKWVKVDKDSDFIVGIVNNAMNVLLNLSLTKLSGFDLQIGDEHRNAVYRIIMLIRLLL